MKIKYINSQGDRLWFTHACSKCGAEVTNRGANYCYGCGHRLSALPKEVPMSDAADVLTAALHAESRNDAQTTPST